MARKIHCEIFHDGEHFRFRFRDSGRFHYVSCSYESLEVWEQSGPSAAADVLLVSDEYQPDSV
jgi:hypothetical protein